MEYIGKCQLYVIEDEALGLMSYYKVKPLDTNRSLFIRDEVNKFAGREVELFILPSE